jgi:cephalosporin-C deacetylase
VRREISVTWSDLSEAELLRYRVATSEPDGLDDWWAEHLSRARSLAKPVALEPYRSDTYGALEVFDLEFSGAEGDRIRGWYLRPAGSGRLPVVITYPGYDRGRGLPIEHTMFPATGFANLVMDVRGPADPTVVIRGITDPDSYYYTRVFVDAARAVDIVAELPGADADRIALSGGSQGGALALASAALCADLVAVCHAEVPMLCDIQRAIRISPMVPYTVIANFLATRPEHAAAARDTLRYVDCALLARRITAPCLLAVGLADQLCPPSTVYAAYHEIASAKELSVSRQGDHRVPKVHTERKLGHLREWLG